MAYEQKAFQRAGDGKRRARGSKFAKPKQTLTMRVQRPMGAVSLSVALLVTAVICLVHGDWLAFPAVAGEKASADRAPPKERAFYGALPQSVVDMREQILAAVHAGTIAELTDAIEWNELKPDFGAAGKEDPIAYWKRTSTDGEGREVLAIIANLLALPPARLAIGRDPENNTVYVWPYLAELPLDSLTPVEEVDLYRLMSPAQAKAMKAAKTWTWWRIAIGADGTWHTFRKYD